MPDHVKLSGRNMFKTFLSMNSGHFYQVLSSVDSKLARVAVSEGHESTDIEGALYLMACRYPYVVPGMKCIAVEETGTPYLKL